MKLNTIDEILADLRAGRMVIIMDDEDRENEGDLIMAAEFVRAEDVNFMARYARGLICPRGLLDLDATPGLILELTLRDCRSGHERPLLSPQGAPSYHRRRLFSSEISLLAR